MATLITDRDKKIIKHMEQYKYATLEHIQKIFFREQANSYNIARRRMAAIREAGYVKCERDPALNRLVYWYNDKGIKMPSRHRLIVLDVLAELHYMGCNILNFDIEKQWMGGKVRSDAFMVFALRNTRCHYFVEVCTSHNDLNLEKYDKLLATDEVHKYIGRKVNPRVLCITDRMPDAGVIQLRHTQAVFIDSRLNDFSIIIQPPSEMLKTLG